MELRKITKTYGGREVLNVESLSIRKCEVLGIMGANGSGKTTLLRIMGNALSPSSGEILDPYPPETVSALFGYQNYLTHLTCRNNLELLIRRMERNPKVGNKLCKERLGIDVFEGKKYGALSQGMKKRLAIYTTLLYPKNLYLFDEPTNGLDIEGIRVFMEIVKELRVNAAIVISSHHSTELQPICSRFAFMKDGKIAYQDNTDAIRDKFETVNKAYHYWTN
ncbi:ATP-binding cassette domain-containing protein [Flavihumibacter sp. ZG627]|uniref:ATP-binding cassette domain-containing protein n=1 Tax=Flavihumibacter sp. ZG627 TaxID=1463156 RepID=UPI00057DBFB4|nr:ABC transporter ATP-binding protein [Flavihumibacter sp. ZG627]KIC91287.1 hypothetical protein HY58_09865 [Flavihumibacter sp. ZG627]